MSFARLAIIAAPLSVPLIASAAIDEGGQAERMIEIALPPCSGELSLVQDAGEGRVLVIRCAGTDGWERNFASSDPS